MAENALWHIAHAGIFPTLFGSRHRRSSWCAHSCRRHPTNFTRKVPRKRSETEQGEVQVKDDSNSLHWSRVNKRWTKTRPIQDRHHKGNEPTNRCERCTAACWSSKLPDKILGKAGGHLRTPSTADA